VSSPLPTAPLPSAQKSAANNVLNHSLEEHGAIGNRQEYAIVGNIYDSIDDVPTQYMSMTASSLPPQPPKPAAATASLTDGDDTPTRDRLNHSVKEVAPIDDQQDNSCRNISNPTYDSIDEVPVTYQNVDAPASQPAELLPATPEATAAAEASFSIDADNVYIHPPTKSINDGASVYSLQEPVDGESATAEYLEINEREELPTYAKLESTA